MGRPLRGPRGAGAGRRGPFSRATTAKVYIRNLRFYDHFALFSLVSNATECPVDVPRLMKEFLG
jgi:hypothetical protein